MTTTKSFLKASIEGKELRSREHESNYSIIKTLLEKYKPNRRSIAIKNIDLQASRKEASK